jgi:histidine triad (HIT) family protein
MPANCLFCKIVARTLPAEILFEDDKAIVIKDIHPKAPVHVLVVPKQHIDSITSLTEGDDALVGHMVLVAKQQAEKLGVAESGYKLIFNVGQHGGQTVPHIHLHILGGKQLQE